MRANLFALLREQIRSYGDRRAGGMQIKGGRHRIPVREYDAPARAVDLCFYRLDVGTGDNVSPPAHNRRECIKSDLPTRKVGYRICDSESKISISTDKTTLQKILDVLVTLSAQEQIVVIDADGRLVPGRIVQIDKKRVMQDEESEKRPDCHGGWENDCTPEHRESFGVNPLFEQLLIAGSRDHILWH
jgi:hypothetical protein